MIKRAPVKVLWEVTLQDQGEAGWAWVAVSSSDVSMRSVHGSISSAAAVEQVRTILVDGAESFHFIKAVSCPKPVRKRPLEGDSSKRQTSGPTG